MRLATANTYNNTLNNLTQRQSDLADLQEKLSAGKKVVRPSDDPTGAAQAERSLMRSARIEVEQRALNLQRNSVQTAESTLGEATLALQRFRDLVVNAGNGGYTEANRSTIAQELRGLRDQLFSLANMQDSNGMPVFGGLGSTRQPFTDSGSTVTFNGLAGQNASLPTAIPSFLDGGAVWMDVPQGNGQFKASLGSTNTGGMWSDSGQVVDPSAVTGDDYTITFNVDPTTGDVTYDVVNTTTGGGVAAGVPHGEGQAIIFDGLSVVAHGKPATGDTIKITANTTPTNLFAVMDRAIQDIETASSSASLYHGLSLALSELDNGMNRIQAARSLAGDLLNRAGVIDSNQQTKTLQLTADRSRAEDMDLVKGISDFQNQQTGMQTALQTYAQIQRLSLFNYMG